MIRFLRVIGILAAVGAMAVAAVPAQGGGAGGGPRGGYGRGGLGGAQQAPPVSIPDQFFGQAAAQQQAFFSQSMSPSTNFIVTPMFQPGLARPRATSAVIVVPSQFSYIGNSSAFPSSSGLYSIGGGLFPASTNLVSIGGGLFPTPGGAYVTTPPVVTSWQITPSHAPVQTRIQMGLIGRW
jgi:hypothetical protein